jgi:hypothetical protein
LCHSFDPGALKKDGIRRSAVAVSKLLKKEGFAKLPRRYDEERPPGTRPTAADQADVGRLDLEPRTFTTKFGGLFLFLPALIGMSFDRVIHRCSLPGPNGNGPIAKAWHAEAWPALYVLDAEGIIRFRNVYGAELDQAVDALLGDDVPQ